MHKKVEAELVSLANSILQMKNRENVNELHKKSLEIYEKLSVLKFVDAYINSSSDEILIKNEEIVKDEPKIVEEVIKKETPIVELESKAEVTSEVIPEVAKEIEPEDVKLEPEIEPIIEVEAEVEVEMEIEEPVINTIEKIIENEEKVSIENEVKDSPIIQVSLEEEFKDAISADVATSLFEKATAENPVIEAPKEVKSRSLNDTLFKNNLQVGLNDRIAFVKYLFDGSQEDFNRVVSQLNSFKVELDAKNFLTEFVKPDYDWSGKEEYEERLINLIERKFM
ncbi:hypothetical protein [Lutibacter citreus]|uniref:hypothetical protein n=1 Tax=Lutibacter citreus TaxID=2138210 RepID=UPI000DBE9336|nr:hypothetical protein [Lutibacter citreus]